MSWTVLVAIMLLPAVSFLIRRFLAEPLERLAVRYLPPKWAKALTKEHGDKRDAEKRIRDIHPPSG